MIHDSETDTSDFSESDLQHINDSDSDSSLENNFCPCGSVNMINDEKEFLIDIIDKIEDPDIKKQYL